MTLTKDERHAIRTMMAEGGDYSFIGQLGKVLLNTDTSGHFLKELATLYGLCDKVNAEKVLTLLADCRRLVEANQRDRFTEVAEAFDSFWADYAPNAPPPTTSPVP